MNPVYFYTPNLIGYTRILLAIAAFAVCFDNYVMFYACYAASQLLDMLDGHMARLLNQTSKFGAVLDMVTDRSSTACLLLVLGVFYPSYLPWFLFVVALDITSHYSHLFSTMCQGSTSHKTLRADQNALLRLYYHNRYVLAFMCAGNEGFFLTLYMLHFNAGPPVSLLGFDTSAFALFAAACFPVMALKQIISIVQWMGACSDIAAIDVKERAKAGTAANQRVKRSSN